MNPIEGSRDEVLILIEEMRRYLKAMSALSDPGSSLSILAGGYLGDRESCRCTTFREPGVKVWVFYAN